MLSYLLKRFRRWRIDTAFRVMAHDVEYLRQAEEIAESFAQSDWEALQIGTAPEQT